MRNRKVNTCAQMSLVKKGEDVPPRAVDVHGVVRCVSDPVQVLVSRHNLQGREGRYDEWRRLEECDMLCVFALDVWALCALVACFVCGGLYMCAV